MSTLISIITPIYNGADFVEETIQSVQAQSHCNWEMHIIDDCSTDTTAAVIAAYIKKTNETRVHYQCLAANGGPAIARNTAIKNARGRYLAFLDADDLWDTTFLEKSLEKVKQSKGFVFSSYRRIAEFSSDTVYHDFIVPEKVSYTDILKTNSISCLTAFIDMEKLGKEYMPEVRYRQDMGLWLKYLKKIPHAEGITEVLASYRIRGNSHSRNKAKLLKPQWFFYRKVESLSIISSAYYMLCWAYNGYFKYKK